MISATEKNSQVWAETLQTSKPIFQLKPLVLILERNEENRFMLKTLLETWSYEVVEAENESEVIRAAGRLKPDLIILDLSFSLMECLFAVFQIRKIKGLNKIPVIFTSGHAQAEIRAIALALGGNDFFVKPFDFDELKFAVNNFVKPIHYNKYKLGGISL